MKVDEPLSGLPSEPEPPEARVRLEYEPPRLEAHGTWNQITGLSLPISGGAGSNGLLRPLDYLDRLLGY